MHSDKSPFPSAPQTALLLVAGFLLQYVLGAAFYDFRHVLGITNEQLEALTVLLANGILITAVMHMRKMSHRDLIHPNPSSPLLALTLLVPPVLLLVPLVILCDTVLIDALESVLPVSAWEQRAFEGMTAPTLPAFVATCLIAPVVEEMLFRGIILRAFLDRYPRGIAIGYSALFFGAAHMNIYQFFVAFLIGLLLGWLYERSRSLVPCIALHAAVNTAVVMLDWSNASAATPDASAMSASTWLAAAAAATVGTLILRRFLSAKKVKTANVT